MAMYDSQCLLNPEFLDIGAKQTRAAEYVVQNNIVFTNYTFKKPSSDSA